MALIELSVEFKQVIAVLSRIADALDRAYPPIQIIPDKVRGKESIGRHDARYHWQQEQDRKKKVPSPEAPEG